MIHVWKKLLELSQPKKKVLSEILLSIAEVSLASFVFLPVVDSSMPFIFVAVGIFISLILWYIVYALSS